jgi:hypothetical protein
MALDPRTFLVTNCDTNKKGLTAATKKRDFFSALGKAGDLEVLNSVGGGRIGEGLRTLSSVSDAVRTGRSVVPGREGDELFNTTLGRIANTALDAVNNGANVVLDTVGLGNAVEKVQGLNPGVANRAFGQGKAIFERVKQGNFELRDIPEALQDFQNLEKLARGIFTPPPSETARDLKLCGASPYAMDLIRMAPKQKFLFVLDIKFRQPYQLWQNIGKDMAFVVKQSTRPTVEFEYDEINMYNFRTRVPKRTIYPPMTLTFYDDNQNNANLFYTAYLRAMSPIANITGNTSVAEYQNRSMDRNPVKGTTFGDNAGKGTTTMFEGAASLGALDGGVENILSEVRLFHIFEYGRLMNVYNFYHPKILRMNLDDLTMMESGAGSEMSIEFAYDGLYVNPNYALNYEDKDFDIVTLTSPAGGDGTLNPIRPNFGGDVRGVGTSNKTGGTDNAPTAQDMLKTTNFAAEFDLDRVTQDEQNRLNINNIAPDLPGIPPFDPIATGGRGNA